MKYRIIERKSSLKVEYMPQEKRLGIWWCMCPFWSEHYSTAQSIILESKAKKEKKEIKVVWEE